MNLQGKLVDENVNKWANNDESGDGEEQAVNNSPMDLLGIEMLSDTEKTRLVESLWLRDFMKSQRLRDQMGAIDQSPNPQKALQYLRSTNSEFDEFVYKMMSTLEGEDVEKDKRWHIRGRKRKI